jgi:hypothetical protein
MPGLRRLKVLAPSGSSNMRSNPTELAASFMMGPNLTEVWTLTRCSVELSTREGGKIEKS